MARKFGPFDLSVFYEVENRRLQRAFNPRTGFVKTGQGAVTAGTGAELVIAAYPDGALIDGLYVENPASETVAVTTNTGSTNPRIDRLVMRLDMSAKTIAPFQIVGTPGSSPQAPNLTQNATTFDMPLCQYRFPGSASAQNPGSIVDERVIAGDSGWINLAAPGWTVGFNRYRVVNGVCHWSANLTRSSWASGAIVTNLPVDARPSLGVFAFGTTAKEMYDIAVNETGVVNVAQSGTGGLVIAGSWPVG